MWNFYKNLLRENLIWLKRAVWWSLIWAVVGGLTFIFRPELLQTLGRFLDEAFRGILGTEELALNFKSVLLIFKNNFLVAALSLFLGIGFGLVPLLALAVNFFILGFLLAVFVLAPPVSAHLPGLITFLITLLPHGVIEIVAFLITTAFGVKLGFAVGQRKKVLKENLELLPLLALLFFIAAILEVFVTGNLVAWVTK